MIGRSGVAVPFKGWLKQTKSGEEEMLMVDLELGSILHVRSSFPSLFRGLKVMLVGWCGCRMRGKSMGFERTSSRSCPTQGLCPPMSIPSLNELSPCSYLLRILDRL